MQSVGPSSEVNRLVAAFRYSVQGVKIAWSQLAFRTEVRVSLVMAPLAFWIAQNGVELALLLGSLWLVMIVEMLNTGVEKAIDRVSSDWHELSRQAKDVASAAVLLSIMNALTVWSAILFL